jgi:Protein of unknown function (DUF2752)
LGSGFFFMINKRLIKGGLLTIWLALPLVLWILPADHFDVGTPICPSRLLFDQECPGCGLIRATQHMMHLDFTEAWHFNKLVVITFPLCIMLYMHVLGLIIDRPIFSFMSLAYKRNKR